MPARTFRLAPGTVWILIAAGVLFHSFVFGPALIWSFSPDAPRNDFVSFYSGGALAWDARLYDLDAMQQFQERIGVRADQHRMAFIRPPFYAVLLSPFAALPYYLSYAFWQTLACASFLAIAWLWQRMLDSPAPAIVLAWSLPVYFSLLRGQDSHLFLLFYSLSVWLILRGKHFAAGAVLSLALLKWIFLLPLPLLMIRNRMWRFAAGLCSAAGGLAIIGVLAQGRHWVSLYVDAILRPTASPNLYAMPTLRGLVHGLDYAFAFEVAGAVVVLCGFWMYLGTTAATASIWVTQLLAGLLIGHHAFLYDGAILVPFLGSALSSEAAPVRALGVLLVLPFVWGALLFPGWAYIPQIALTILFAAVVVTARRSGMIQ
jgi:hypothetical protein